MHCEIEFLPFGLSKPQAVPKQGRRLFGNKIDSKQTEQAKDVKMLTGFKHRYRQTFAGGSARLGRERRSPSGSTGSRRGVSLL